MDRQRLLFQAKPSPWVEELWRRVPQKRRDEVIAILAEMVKSTWPRTREDQRREGTDES